jgi:hypothetical protein
MNKFVFYILISLSILTVSRTFGKTEYGKFYDEKRKREIPYKVYYPDALQGIYPVVIYSHGLGGSVEGGAYLGEHLSQNGYICFHIQHEGSDESVYKNAKNKEEAFKLLSESIKDYKNAINRFQDVPFAVSRIIELNSADGLFNNHLDTNNIAIIGHSYGAKSVLISAGEKIANGMFSFKDSRLKVGVALSPSLPIDESGDLKKIYSDINIPLFHITGTNDGDPLNQKSSFTPEDRTKPYRNISGAPQYLLVLYKAVHSSFSGVKERSTDDPYIDEHIENVKKGVTAFLNYYLKNNDKDGSWLKNEYKNTLSSKDTFEWKK